MTFKPSEYAFLRSQENDEWNANGLGTKENIKRKIAALKESVKQRQDISREDYAKLMGNRKRRIERIAVLRRVLLSQPRLYRVGVDDESFREIFAPLKDDREIHELLDQSQEFLGILDEYVFQHGMSRQEFRKALKKAEGSGSVKDFDISEFGVDWIVWRLEPYVELLANLMGIELEDLTINQAQWIADLSKVESMEYQAESAGVALPHWYLPEQQMTRACQALPSVQTRIHPQI